MRYKLEIILVTLVIASIKIISFTLDNPSFLSQLKSKALYLAEPVYSMQDAVQSSISSAWEGYVSLIGAKDRIKQLERNNKELELALALSKEKIYENLQLRELLKFRNRSSFKSVPANITTNISRGGEVTIDIGKSSGVSLGDSIIDGSCVVGKVIATSKNFSKVQLITNPLSSIGVLVKETRLKALAEGHSMGTLSLKYLDPLRDVIIGQSVLSSGDDGFIPRGLEIGRIIKIEFSDGIREVEVEPCANLATIDSVLVLINDEEVEIAEFD